MRIHTWLKETVNNPLYADKLWWHDREKGLIAIHWKHASFDDYSTTDSILFRQWAIVNRRYDPDEHDSPEERKRWKTNFRCALHSATNIRKVETHTNVRNTKQAYRIYELLDKPDPEKVDQKKKSNQRAAKSKQKTPHEKRSYRSRLNKVYKKDIKQEPTICQPPVMQSVSKRNANRKKESVPVDIVKRVDSPLSQVNETSVKEEAPLPSTLDSFHEEEDGYFSFSDSSSVNSQESSYSPSSGYHSDSSPVPLAPVETFFSSDGFGCDGNETMLPGVTGYDGQCCYESNIDDSLTDECYMDEYEPTNNLYTQCGEWGTEVLMESCISSPNVVTQFYVEQSNSNRGAMQNAHYILTTLH